MTCRLETFVGTEPIEDSDGDPAGEVAVYATCNGTIANNCGWQRRLIEFDPHPTEWWMTSGAMGLLHAEHHAWSHMNPIL